MPWTPGRVTTDGNVHVVFARAKRNRIDMDFDGFVDAVLWLGIIKYPRFDISVAFWRILKKLSM